jgi:prepilin signal peptidase PulO-like enzyme (type II secretory pathway)
MSAPLLGLIAAALGVAVGAATHWLNQVLGRAEEEATEPPLPGERYWAPVLDAAVLGFLFYRFGVNATSVAAALLVVVLVQVFVFDARHHLILNRVMYPAMALALLASPVNPLIEGTSAPLGRVVSAVLGAVVGGGFFLLLTILSRGGVGLGDAKLTFFLGAALGLLPLYASPILHALIYGVVIGGVIAAALLISRVRGMRDYIAYGPFLCIGGVTTVLFPCALLSTGTC